MQDVEEAGVLFDSPEEAKLWTLAPKLLIMAKLLESAVNEVDNDIALDIRQKVDVMAVEVLLQYRGQQQHP